MKNKQIEEIEKDAAIFNAKTMAEDEAFIDKKIVEYLERAIKILQNAFDLSHEEIMVLVEESYNEMMGDIVQIAKMIQREEHYDQR